MARIFARTLQTPFGDDLQKIIQSHVSALRYGSVEIVIHDSRIVQVEITERLRFGDPPLLAGAARTNDLRESTKNIVDS